MNAPLYTGPAFPQDALTVPQKASFEAGYETILLPAGTVLWRFISKRNDSPFGNFWLDPETMSGIMQNLQQMQSFSQQAKKENVRNSLAVLSEWSNLSWRVKVRLINEVVAYRGNTGTQKLFKEATNTFSFSDAQTILKVVETRLGRQLQYVVPRLGNPVYSAALARVELIVHI